MDKTYAKIFAVLFFISGIIFASLGTMWLNAAFPMSEWSYYASHNMWWAMVRGLALHYLIMIPLGFVLMGVAAYLHRRAKNSLP